MDRPTPTETHPQPNPERRRRRTLWRLSLLGGVGALGLALAVSIPVRAGHGHGWMRDGEFFEFVIERKLERIDATEEQRTRVLEIAGDAREALLALRGDETPRAALHDFIDQLVSDPDAADTLEALRSAQIERVEAGSRILVDAMARMASELTPEQREALAAQHRERHGHWHR